MNSNREADYEIKILTLGESSVGKTAIIVRYFLNTFSEKAITTTGIDVQKKKMVMFNKVLEIRVWDTAGQEKFRSLSKQFYNKTQGILLIYDITSRNSFEALKIWLKDIKANLQTNAKIILVGNKIDLGKGEVDREEAMQFSIKNDIQLFFTSAKTGEGIENAMTNLIESIYNDIIVKNGDINDNNKGFNANSVRNNKKKCDC